MEPPPLPRMMIILGIMLGNNVSAAIRSAFQRTLWDTQAQDRTIWGLVTPHAPPRSLPTGSVSGAHLFSSSDALPRKEIRYVLREHEIEIRVRYQDADPMGLLHHGNYFAYFEIGRTELLRASGGNYRRMEEEGIFAVVVKAECTYHKPASYDDLLTIRTVIKRITPAKIEHEYQVLRDGQCLATGQVTLALVDRRGNVMRVPDWLTAVEPERK